MKYLSVCDGIGAAHVAWEPLGWTCSGASEIAKFPIAVVKHRRPHIAHLGNMLNYHDWNIERGSIGLVCGGTPCQDYSIAGSRAGMAGERGGLTGTFVGIIEAIRPEWVVWENVVGVHSSNEGRDFAAFLSGLAGIGYGWSYRVLDAEFTRVDGYPRAIPQRRRRVWVVAHSSGRWQYPFAVLQERQILSWHAPPRREAGEAVAGTLKACAGKSGARNGAEEADNLIVVDTQQITSVTNRSKCEPGEPAPTISRGSSLIVLASSQTNAEASSVVSPTLLASHERAVLIRMRQGKPGGGKGALVSDDTSLTLATANDQTLITSRSVRALTPIEYERLFGFPDDYTLVPWRRKMASDTVRYRALGNSWTINQARWIGMRIEQVRAIISNAEAA